MEVVILRARAQLNRLVSGEKRAGGVDRSPRAEGGGGAARGGAGRERNANMAPAAPAPVSAAPWLNATLIYNTTRLNATFDTDFDLLNSNSTDEHHHWFCAKWTNAQQDLFQVVHIHYLQIWQSNVPVQSNSTCNPYGKKDKPCGTLVLNIDFS